MADLSILIPARNEMFLQRTLDDLLANIEGDTEIIVVLDGASAEVTPHPKVRVIYNEEAKGQRAAINQAARLSEAKYVMKVDAHCAFDKGFDVKMMADMQDDWTMTMTMRNLHAFDWVCPDGHRRYQGQSGVCVECGKETTRDVVWIPKTNPQSNSFCFDSEPHFQYFGEFNRREEGRGDITPTMSLQGSCFMLTREKFFELNICDEAFGSWGSQGIEVACKTWLSGGKVMVNRKTWYAHLFRTQGGDFGFPYPQSQSQIDHAKATARELFYNNKWPKQKYPLSWLVKKFWPVKGWSASDLNRICPEVTKGVVYISDVRLDESILKKCRDQLRESFSGRIVSVTLKPIDFGENIVLPLKREKPSIFKQILAGLEALDTDVVFLCDDDVLYHPSHFDFVPPRNDTYYYDLNWWRIRTSDGFAVHWKAKQSNLLCADRKLLIQEYRERVRKVEAEGWHNGGYEPGTRSLRKGGFSDSPSDYYEAKCPSLDLRHGRNLTGDKWSPEDFVDKRQAVTWVSSHLDKIDSWKGTIITSNG